MRKYLFPDNGAGRIRVQVREIDRSDIARVRTDLKCLGLAGCGINLGGQPDLKLRECAPIDRVGDLLS